MENFHPFRSIEAQQAYLAYYDQRAKEWPVPSETKMVDTFLGQTFVRISGSQDAPPLVLLPGSVMNSLMWIPNVEALAQAFRVYAVDNIYDVGRSIYSCEPKTPEDFIVWLDELFTKLDLGDRINLMGLSYGSWLAHLYAFQHPERTAKVVLLAHPALVSPNFGFVFRFMRAIFIPKTFKNFVEWMFEDTLRKGAESEKLLETIYEDMFLGSRSFTPKRIVTPKVVDDRELKNLEVPTLFMFGKNEKTFSYEKAVQRLNKTALDLQIEVIPFAGHDLSFAQAESVNQKVLKFLGV